MSATDLCCSRTDPDGAKLAPAGHWHMKLDGHGLVYFDELVVQYRTLPKLDPLTDPQFLRAQQAAQTASAAKTAYDTAAQAAVVAKAAAAEPNLDAAEKSRRATEANSRITTEQAAARALEAANLALAKAQAAVDAPISAASIILELIQRRAADQSLWSDVLIFESALLRLVPPEALKVRLQALRQEYQDALGAGSYAAIRESLLDLRVEAIEPKKMLAEADSLLGDIHWHYTTTPRLEWQKTGLMLKLGCYLGVVAVVLILFALFSDSQTVAWVLLAGAFGASLSAVQRIQRTSARGNALLCIREAKWHTVSIGLAPMLGALFGFLLMLIFAGGLLEGAAFPKVQLMAEGTCTNHAPVSTTSTTSSNQPVLPNPVEVIKKTNQPVAAVEKPKPDSAVGSTNHSVQREATVISRMRKQEWCVAGADLALLLLWAFIAGFSERLVPDLLTRVSAKAEIKN
jgi:hypothetical protein